MAVNCLVDETPMLGSDGVTAMDTSVGCVTVRVVEPVMLPNVAEIVVVPADAAVASPIEPDALLIVATVAADELHVTDAVRSFEVLSV